MDERAVPSLAWLEPGSWKDAQQASIASTIPLRSSLLCASVLVLN